MQVKILEYTEGSLGLPVVKFIDESGKERVMLVKHFVKKYGNGAKLRSP